jgi:hypothetical protein
LPEVGDAVLVVVILVQRDERADGLLIVRTDAGYAELRPGFRALGRGGRRGGTAGGAAG